MQQVSSLKDSIPRTSAEPAATLSVELVIKKGAVPFFNQELRAVAKVPIDLPADGQDLSLYLEEAWRRAAASMKIEAMPERAISRRKPAARKKPRKH